VRVLERLFHLSERGSTVGRELRGGLVTFVTMSYIIVLNPLILGSISTSGPGAKPDALGNVLGIRRSRRSPHWRPGS
jgi:adenine/guanine/hypoxanthine permease